MEFKWSYHIIRNLMPEIDISFFQTTLPAPRKDYTLLNYCLKASLPSSPNNKLLDLKAVLSDIKIPTLA